MALVCGNCQETPMSQDDPREYCSRCDPRGLNTSATFSPQREPFTRPCLTVADAQVYVYVDEDGYMVVSVDLEDCLLWRTAAGELVVPLRIMVGGTEVI